LPIASRKRSSARFGGTRTRSNRGAVRTEYRGTVYASKSEANYARYLDALVKAKKVSSWEGQVRVSLVVNGSKVCVMVPDFLVTHRNGRAEYVEVKGFETPVYKLKRKLFAALFPDAWYTVVPAKKALAL
jgi:predicted nuclease of restriction endonuclease-like RecB superfamily